MYIVVGLGNPGDRYKNTRHNVGWIVMNTVFPDVSWKKNIYAHAIEATDMIAGESVLLVQPQTFMNESGISLAYYMKKTKVSPHHCIILYDDLDLPLGTVRISFDRGSGGHNGIRSLERSLGTREFIRVRIGIAKRIDDTTASKPNVLGNFEPEEYQQVIGSISKNVEKIIKSIITEGKEKAMTQYNI